MKLTNIVLLGGLLAFTACDTGPEDEFGGEIDDPRIDSEAGITHPTDEALIPDSGVDSAASSSQRSVQRGEPVDTDGLPPVPPRDEIDEERGIPPSSDSVDIDVERVVQPPN